jgi:hypothetical protein
VSAGFPRDPLFGEAADAVWKQLFELHLAVQRSPDPQDPWRREKEAEYRGGLTVLCRIADHAGADVTFPHPLDSNVTVFSLTRTQEILIEWAQFTRQAFPRYFTENTVPLPT